jgi:hypothetical protein
MPYSDQPIGARQRFNRLYLEPKMKIGSGQEFVASGNQLLGVLAAASQHY